MNVENYISDKANEYFTQNKIKNFKATPLVNDASTRSYFLIEGVEDPFVACVTEPNNKKQNEAFIYWNKIYRENGIPVPKIYFHTEGLILQEYLGVQSLIHSVGGGTKNEIREVYDFLINYILKIGQMEKSRDYQYDSFDEKKLDFEVDHTCQYFIQKILGANKEVSQIIQTEFQKITRVLAQHKKIICHRDFHSKNIMRRENGEVAIIDFQDSMLGLPQYDLCSLLEDCYFDIGRELRWHLKKSFWGKSKELEGFYAYDDFEVFQMIYDFSAIQRLFKAIGSFSYMKTEKKNEGYLKYIGFAMEKLRLLMMKYEDFKVLRKTLFKYYYES
ncbi:MAG: phosphotransferase [Halobacteriovoraceae bacterium]|nr:phosphotransferase [Halobacteriovoraceae bacterium]